MTDELEPLITTKQVAELLGVSRQWVLDKWAAGELPGFRLPNRVLRFRRSEILAALETWRNEPSRSSDEDSS